MNTKVDFIGRSKLPDAVFPDGKKPEKKKKSSKVRGAKEVGVEASILPFLPKPKQADGADDASATPDAKRAKSAAAAATSHDLDDNLLYEGSTAAPLPTSPGVSDSAGATTTVATGMGLSLKLKSKS